MLDKVLLLTKQKVAQCLCSVPLIEVMAWQAPLCAVAINCTNPDGSVVSQRYWAQVVQVDDPRLDRPRYEIDLLQEWALGVEPGRPTTRFLKKVQRNQEHWEQRQHQQEAAN